MLGPTNLVDMVGRKEEAVASARQLYQVNPPEANLFTCSFQCTLLSFFCIISTSTARARKRMRKKIVLDACNAFGPIVRAAWCSVLQTCGSLSSLSFHHYYLHFIIIGSWSIFLIKIRNIFWINIVWWELTIVLISTICTQSLWWGRHSSGSLNVRWILQEWFETFKYCLLTWISEAVPIT